MKSALLPPALLALPSCAVGPNFKVPQSPATDRYTASERPPSLASGTDVPYRWWKIYGSTQLDDLVDSALHGSPTITAAQAALRQAHELV